MNTFEFPEYLAFGRLNAESIRIDGEYQVADYYLNEEKVQTVKVSPHRAYFIETLKGKEHSFTCNHTLKEAVQNHFSFWMPSKSEVFNFLVQQTCALGNIFFDYPPDNRKRPRMTFYTAGMMFIIRIPTTKERLEDWDLFVFDPWVSNYHHDNYSTTLTTMSWAGERYTEEIELLELIVPLQQVYYASKWLVYIELVQKERKYRAIIQDVVSKATDSVQVFPSPKEEEYQAYWIEYKQKMPPWQSR